MISLNKTIAYTQNWKPTFLIALLLGTVIPVLLITLEPFDNSNSFSYKYLILSGYSVCIIIPILIFHPIENYVYKIQTKRWFIVNECIYIISTLFVIFIFSSLHIFCKKSIIFFSGSLLNLSLTNSFRRVSSILLM